MTESEGSVLGPRNLRGWVQSRGYLPGAQRNEVGA